jgi:hypothetical protein
LAPKKKEESVKFFFAFFAILYTPFIATAQDKLPIPGDAARKEAAALVINLYKADYEGAKTLQQRSALAKKLLQVGAESKDDSTARYVLFLLAKDVATAAGDVTTAMTAVDHANEIFMIDALAMKEEVLSKIVKILKLPRDHQELARAIQSTWIAAISQDRFDLAKKINATALESARQAKMPELVKQIVAHGKELAVIESEFQKVQPALSKLQTAATDPEANALVGKYECFFKNDWESGLLMLSLGSDENLKSLAAAELADQPDATKLGHAWWEYSQTTQGPPKTAARLRAATWYRQALPQLSGLSQQLVKTRLAEIGVEAASPALSTPSQLRERFAPDAVQIEGRFLKIFDKRGITWEDAAKTAHAMGGRLACLNTQELQSKAHDMTDGKLVWIGAYKDPKAGMIWLNKKPFVWWRNGKPETPNERTYVHLWRAKRNGAGTADNESPVADGKRVPADGYICEWLE